MRALNIVSSKPSFKPLPPFGFFPDLLNKFGKKSRQGVGFFKREGLRSKLAFLPRLVSLSNYTHSFTSPPAATSTGSVSPFFPPVSRSSASFSPGVELVETTCPLEFSIFIFFRLNSSQEKAAYPVSLSRSFSHCSFI